MDFFDLAVKLGNFIEVDEHGDDAEDMIKLQGVPKYSFKDEDAMWGDKPVVDGAAVVPRASKRGWHSRPRSATRGTLRRGVRTCGVTTTDLMDPSTVRANTTRLRRWRSQRRRTRRGGAVCCLE